MKAATYRSLPSLMARCAPCILLLASSFGDFCTDECSAFQYDGRWHVDRFSRAVRGHGGATNRWCYYDACAREGTFEEYAMAHCRRTHASCGSCFPLSPCSSEDLRFFSRDRPDDILPVMAEERLGTPSIPPKHPHTRPLRSPATPAWCRAHSHAHRPPPLTVAALTRSTVLHSSRLNNLLGASVDVGHMSSTCRSLGMRRWGAFLCLRC